MAQGFLVGLPQRLGDANFDPSDAWLVYTWTATGTFTVPLTTYSDTALTVPHTNPIVMNASGYFATAGGITSGAFVAQGTQLDIQVKNAAGVLQFTLLGQMPMATPDGDLISPVITGDGGSGTIFVKQCLFTEDATSLTHTATFTLPAGSTLVDVYVVPQVLWTDSSAAITVGDANSSTGWFQSTNLAATDLILGERLQASNANNWGGKQGAYLTTAGRFGQQSTNVIGGYSPTAYSVIGVVTVSSPSGTAGRTRMYVLWMTGEVVAPVLA